MWDDRPVWFYPGITLLLCAMLIVVARLPDGLRAQPSASLSGTATYNQFHLVAANSDNATRVKVGNAVLIAAQLSTVASSPAYLKFYDKATTPVCQTDVVVKSLMIPVAPTAANGGGSNAMSLGVAFSSGLGFCVVTGIADSDDTAVAAGQFNINFDWK